MNIIETSYQFRSIDFYENKPTKSTNRSRHYWSNIAQSIAYGPKEQKGFPWKNVLSDKY